MSKTNMLIEVIKPLDSCWASLLVDNHYLIETTFTLFRSTRILLREKDDFSLMCNWCAGPDFTEVLHLINTLLCYLETKDEDIIPFCSEIKPIYNDAKFKAQIAPYRNKFFFHDIAEILPDKKAPVKTGAGERKL